MTLKQEVKLSTNPAERDLYDSLAEIYGIIITLDGLEKAYIKDSVTESEYTEICSRLLKQYKNILSEETVSREFVDLETFKKAWDVRLMPFSTAARGLDGLWLTCNMIRWNALGPPSASVWAFQLQFLMQQPPTLPPLPHTPQCPTMSLLQTPRFKHPVRKFLPPQRISLRFRMP